MIIEKLLKRVNQLKRSVHENDCEKCELCSRILNENEVTEHLCEDGLWSMEINKLETPDDILDADTKSNRPEFSLKNEIEPLRNTFESEQPALFHLPNEPKMNLDPINVTQNQHTNNKCNDFFIIFLKYFHPLLSFMVLDFFQISNVANAMNHSKLPKN